MPVHFGEFVVDFEAHQLLSEGRSVHLTPKAYQLLALLVEAQPRALSKEELQHGLWPATFVDEANLTVVMAELRAALGDDARHPRYVRTVYGFGYAFAAPVTLEARGLGHPREPGDWWLISDDLHVKLHTGDNLVGREPPIGVWLDSASVSRHHARIVVDGGSLSLEDLGSRHGTWVNGRRITGRLEIADGDELRFGPIVMRLRWAIVATSTEALGPA
ncbi:MAG: winged helix-turn-helix domain-containing protein [Vicinamibacteria bacterium]|nr:winged helix-turn-helix domain-containing protein [Vicinamibacteria bacterium]